MKTDYEEKDLSFEKLPPGMGGGYSAYGREPDGGDSYQMKLREVKHNFEFAYPTPVYSCMVTDYKNIQREIESIAKKTKWVSTKQKNWGLTHYLSEDIFDGNVIGEKFEKELGKHLSTYIQSFYSNKFQWMISNSWLSLFKKGNYGHVHEHGTSTISGVYYYQTNEKDGKLFFRAPNPYYQSNNIWQNFKQELIVEPKQGLLILFPGWLDHGIQTNETNHDRISLSFNIVVN